MPAIWNPLSFSGMVLTTVSAVVFIVGFLVDVLFGMHGNPYGGIIYFILLPALFVLGLILIPLGAWIERRRRAAGGRPSEVRWPKIDLSDPRQRGIVTTVVVLTVANVVIVSLASYKAVEYMETTQFCGQVCHTVMKPEAVAHQDSPHARIACVECHVGSGAQSFVESKISGSRQLLALTFNTYSKPIPVPVHNLRPARDTCEHCHWPAKFHGEKIKRIIEYADDAKNSETVTNVQLHVGGADRRGRFTGIHWHADPANEIEYVSDEKRETISYIRVKDANGVREYTADGVSQEQLTSGVRRRMDCVDCHNRPAHQIAQTPARAVDAAIARVGGVPNIPFLRREAVKALDASYPSEDAAMEGIAKALREFYSSSHKEVYEAQRKDVDLVIAAAQQVYRRNVFPEMNVKFGTYPSHAGHVDSPGCFRCHDESHKTTDGKTISQDCELCHTIQ